jgi:hypothetical protein
MERTLFDPPQCRLEIEMQNILPSSIIPRSHRKYTRQADLADFTLEELQGGRTFNRST